MNVLSMHLNKAVVDGNLRCHPKCRSLNLMHLFFADDIVIFTNGSVRSAEAVVKTFDHFAAISGLRINHGKSTIYLAGVSARSVKHYSTDFSSNLTYYRFATWIFP